MIRVEKKKKKKCWCWFVLAWLFVVLQVPVTTAVLADATCHNHTLFPRSVRMETSWASSIRNNNKTAITELYILSPELVVVIVGLPRTGTSSLSQALRRLGVTCYPTNGAVFESLKNRRHWTQFTPDNMSLDQIDKKHGDNDTAEYASRYYYYQQQLSKFPRAKIVLTIRSENVSMAGEAWSQSMQESILPLQTILSKAPYRWFPRVLANHVHRTTRILQQLKTDWDSATQLPLLEQLPLAYHEWNQQILASLSSNNNVLVVRATDGWQPLCDYLSPASMNVARRCRTILSDNEPYPHVSQRTSAKQVVWMLVLLREGLLALCLVPVVMYGMRMGKQWQVTQQQRIENMVEQARKKKE